MSTVGSGRGSVVCCEKCFFFLFFFFFSLQMEDVDLIDLKNAIEETDAIYYVVFSSFLPFSLSEERRSGRGEGLSTSSHHFIFHFSYLV